MQCHHCLSPVLFAIPRLFFTSSNLRAAPRGGDIGAIGLFFGGRCIPSLHPKGFLCAPRTGGGWGLFWGAGASATVPSAALPGGAQLLHEPGASRRARAGPLGRAPPLPDCCCNDPGGSNEAGKPRACPSPSPAPRGQLPQRGSCSSGRRSWPPRGPRPHTPGVPLGFPKCFRFGLQSPGHLQRAEEQLLRAPRSSLARGTVCPRDTGTFAPGSVHSSVLGPSSPPSSCAPLAKACAACARPGACSPAELGEVSA